MENWIYFTLLAELIWSFTSFIDKIVFSKGYIKSPFVFIVLNGSMNVLVVFLLPFFSLEPLNFLGFFSVLGAGIFLSLGVIFYYKAVQYEEISRVVVLWQLIPIFVLIMSFLFLGERLTKFSFIGFAFLLSAGFLISYRKINKKFKLSKAFYYMLASTLLISFHYVLAKHVYGVTSFWSAFMWLRLASFSGILVLLLPSVRREFAKTYQISSARTKSLLGFKMLIDFSAFVTLGYATFYGPISLISALGTAAAPLFIFIITSIAAIYFPYVLKEDFKREAVLAKIFAIALTIIGIILVNF